MLEGAGDGGDLSALNPNFVISEQEALAFQYLEIWRYSAGWCVGYLLSCRVCLCRYR